jgi:CRP/FNR family transcriptional regulator, cyclic AMP receptor protein
MRPVVPAKKLRPFDTKTFLSTIHRGRKIVAFSKKRTIYAQGDSSDAVFYIQEGKVKLTLPTTASEKRGCCSARELR